MKKTADLHRPENKKAAPLFLVLALLCFSVTSFAGSIQIATTPPPDGTIHQSYSTTFSLTAGSDMVTPVTWSIDRLDTMNVRLAGLNFNAATHTLSTDSVFTFVGTISFHVDARNSDGTGSDQELFTITVNREPIDLALVLDKSGSMSSLSGTSTVSRWTALTGAVALFMSNLESFSTTNDNIGLTFFDGGVVKPVSGFPTPLISVIGSSSAVNGNFTGTTAIQPGGSTAFGYGLQDGLGKIPVVANRSRFIVTFTDGLQNIPSETYVNVSSATGNHVWLGAIPFSTTPVRIYPIGIGAAGSLPAVLSDISQSIEGGNQAQISTQDGTALSGNYGSDFINVLQTILNAGSPQIVDTRRSTFSTQISGSDAKRNAAKGAANFAGFEDQQSFIVNKKVSKLVFNIVSNAPRELAIISVRKDSTEFIQYGKMTAGTGFRSFDLNLSAKGVPPVKSEGTWTITALSSTQDLYEVTLLADDHTTHYSFSSGSDRLKSGSPINLTARLSYGMPAIKNASVTVLIGKPGDDLGNLLATTPFTGKADSSSDPSTPAEQKYEALIKDSAFLAKLLANNQLIKLNFNASDSSYSGQFDSTGVSGVYQVIFLADVPDDSVHGHIVRYQRKSLYVYFPDVDLPNSNVTLVTKDSLLILTFRPIASNGKFIGPGWGNTIRIDSSTATVQQVVDNGDGSYSITIKGSADATGVVVIGGQTIYSGTLGDITKTGGTGAIWKAWWFWLIILLLLILIIRLLKKKNP
jgi:hypothetical protein